MISPEYKAKIVALHKSRPWGGAVQGKTSAILETAAKFECKSILDFGCGYGALKQSIGQYVEVIEYDQGIEGRTHCPTKRSTWWFVVMF